MDVVTIGETMALLLPQTTGPLRFVNDFRKTIGGAESNVAIALSRLGHNVGWLSRLGNDEFGLFIRNMIRGEGVDTSCVTFDPHYPTAVFFKERTLSGDPKIYYYRKGSACSNLSAEDMAEDYISSAKILHLTGITLALSDSCKKAVYRAIEIARRNDLTVVFDPNIRLKLWSKEEAKKILTEIIPLCDVVLPGLDEGRMLTGANSPEEITNQLLHGYCHTVIIKLGEKGAFYAKKIACGVEEQYVSGYEVKRVLDTVGAGDGFAAGVISGLLRGFELQDCVRLGNRIGASALRVEGDFEGYPYWSDIQHNHNEILR